MNTFRLFHNRQETHRYKKFYLKTEDGWFVYLWGMNMHGKEPSPIYMVGLSIAFRKGWIEIATPKRLIMLRKRKPYIYTERFTEWQLSP